MRPLLIAASLLAILSVHAARAETWAELMEDKARAGKVEDGIKILKEYFGAEADLEREEAKQNPRSATVQRLRRKRDDSLAEFLSFLSNSGQVVGLDLAAQPGLVVEILDRGRVSVLETPKRGIEYMEGNAAGIRGDRFEFAVMCPDTYKKDGEERYPLVVSLHERVINPKHPAFRGNAGFEQRSRQTIYNNWFKTPSADLAVVLAPTGKPNGFKYERDEAYVERQKLFRTLMAGLRDYRTDWNEVFVEVHGAAIRLLCEQALVFAGAIVREREDDRTEPVLKPEEFFLLRNLNGLPLIYIADEANWDTVGKSVVEELQKLYAEEFKLPGNLVVMKSTRGPNGELPGDPEKIAEFLKTHRRPDARNEFHWRFANGDQTGPEPIQVLRPDFTFDKTQPLEKTAGSIHFRYSQASESDADGKTVAFNKVEIDITQAEELQLSLQEHLFDLDLPVSVYVNGKLVLDKEKVQRDWTIFCSKVLPARFFMLPIVAQLKVEFPLKPQYEAPKPPPTEGETATEGEGAGEEGSGTSEAGTEDPEEGK